MKIARNCVCCGAGDLDRSPAVLMPFVAHRVFGWEPVEITPDWGLRTLRTGMAYPLCASLQCRSCGLLFLDMRFDDEEMGALYGGYRGEAYAAARDRFEPGYRARNESILAREADSAWEDAFLAPLLPARPRVLDWGGDTGRYAPFASTAAAIEVLDISDRPLVEGARRVCEAEIGPGRHDLVVLSHVLEHAPWPGELLGQVKAAMDGAAVLYLEVPFEPLVAADPAARDLAGRKKHWHEHVNFFTEDALRALIARAGLEVLAWKVRARESHANFAQVISAACRLAPR